MNRQVKFSFVPGLVSALCIALFTATVFSQDSATKTGRFIAQASEISGQSRTLLPTGLELLLGGKGAGAVTGAASLLDPQTGVVAALQNHLQYPRAWQSATVLSDGTVAIIGGVGKSGRTVGVVEGFDPQTQTFSVANVSGITPRSHHTATLLSDGTILVVGGLSAQGKTLADAQLWNPRTGQVNSVVGGLNTPRSGHMATLQSNGSVLIQGGADQGGNKINSTEVYDPKLESFAPVSTSQNNAGPFFALGASSPAIAGTIPADGATGVPVNTIISLRFSEAMQVETVDADTVRLTGPDGNIAATVVAAEGGMLAFVNPNSALAPNATYTVTVDGVVARDGAELAKATFSFTTGSATTGPATLIPGNSTSAGGQFDSAGVWIPTSDWRTHLPSSPWQSLPALMAPKGVTALSGQVLTIDGNPLVNVTLQVGNRKVLSDGSGRFLLPGVQGGNGVLLIDGTSANRGAKTYGIFEVAVSIAPRVTNVLPYTIWMPVLDTAHAATIPSPTTQETIVTNPLMPGLELHIPAGTTITDINGKVVRTITMTPVPLDRTPFPLPAGVDVPIYFTIQPGGAQLWNSKGKWAWAQLYYPNPGHLAPGVRFDFWDYEADANGWYVYGQGSVNKDGSEIIPDRGVGFWEFTGAMVGSPQEPPTTGDKQCDSCSDPVDTSTGIFRHSETDLHLADIIPIDVTRTYLSQDTASRPFGTGMTDNYEIYITNNRAPNYTALDVVLPDGQKVHYVNTSSCYNCLGGWTVANYVATRTSDPAFYGSVITWNASNNNGWLLKLKNGTIYGFPANGTTPAASALLTIADRYGNQLTITRDPTNNNITQITSPNGRWVQFTHDSSNRLTQASDDLGRTVSYTYDTCGTGFLCSVKDANGGTTSYSYYTSSNPPPSGDGGVGNMSKIIDPRGNAQMMLIYDGNGRVKMQTLADGTSTFQYAYTLSSNVVTRATITDPNLNVEQKSFDSNEFVTTDIYAMGSTVAQTYSYTRDPNSERITAMTDPLGRQFSYGYDSFQLNNYLGQAMTLTHGNLLSVTCSNCLAQSITTSMTYDPTFNQPTSVTDALSHTWSIGYDSRGNATSITDPLTHQVTLGYNLNGQVTSFTDAANDAVSFTYNYGDLATITDPLSNTIHRLTDNAGRVISITDALGNLTQLAYDNLDHVTQITDANNGLTKFAYDAAENLLNLTDANTNVTAYTYDSRNRAITRKDALLISESYGYDGNSNLTSHTDRNGNVINYSYDALNRLSQAQYKIPGGVVQSTVNYTLDAGNRVTKAVDSIAGTINRTYDGLDDLTQEATPQGTVNYTYDNAGRRSTMQVVGQSQATYTFDNANRLTAISQGSAVGFSYDNANRRTCLTLPNGVIATYGYDKDSRVTSITYGTGGSCSSPSPPSNLGSLTYTYDSDGRRTATAGSLAAVTLPANLSGGNKTTYNADNEQTKFNNTRLSYDSNGNLTGDGTNTYTFDARNHLTAISGGATASFVYDGFGRRIKKVVSGTTTQFLYDDLNPVQELNSTGGVVANLLTGLGIDEYFTRTDTATSTFLADALGSTIGLVTSNNGPIATNYTYQPFGSTTVGGSANGNSYQFTGRENDGTGLYFNRARYYSPTFQRFIAQDPSDFYGGDVNEDASEGPVEFNSDFNSYGYTRDDPVDWYDPDGEARRGGRPGKGERGRARTNPNPQKHTRRDPKRPDCYQQQDPHTGKWVDKPPGWTPETITRFSPTGPEMVVGGVIIIGGAIIIGIGTGGAAIIIVPILAF